MVEKYDFAKPFADKEKNKNISVVNICDANGVESGLPRQEQGEESIRENDVVVIYDEALIKNTAMPVFVGIPHAGELIPKEVAPRVKNMKGFADGLDCGTAMIFSPKKGEKYIAARSRISRLIADANRGPRQFQAGAKGIGGVTWKTNLQEQPIYHEGQEPTDEEMAENVDKFYTPYYTAMHDLAASLYEKMGYKEILLIDAHSFPGNVDFPKYQMKAGDPKPLFIIGNKDNASASEEITRIFQEALVKHSPAKDEYPALYNHISDIAVLNAPFKGVRNVEYFGHPEGIAVGQQTDADEKGKRMPYKIHAIQLEMNMSTFFNDGKYDLQTVELLRQTIQKAIEEVGNKLKTLQK